MKRFRPQHSTVVAYLALVIALSGTAFAATGARQHTGPGVANAGHFFNSGLVKMNVGVTKTIVKRGPFQIVAKCTDDGGGYIGATLLVKNTGSKPAVLESDLNGEYDTPSLAPGASREGFYAESNNAKYFFGDYYNLFSAAAPDGTAITGSGSIGWKVLGADCTFQLVLVG